MQRHNRPLPLTPGAHSSQPQSPAAAADASRQASAFPGDGSLHRPELAASELAMQLSHATPAGSANPSAHRCKKERAAGGMSDSIQGAEYRGTPRSAVNLGPRQAAAHDAVPDNASAVSLFRDGLLSLLLFLLLCEWLQPLPLLSDVSEVYNVRPFMVVFVICIALDWLRVPYAWGWILKGFLVLAFIGYMFEPAGLPVWSWPIDFGRLLAEDVVRVLHGDLGMISGQSRTLLFLTGWILLISVTQALMLQRQHSLWFVGMTLLYLALLQLALGADTTYGMIRTLGYGALLLALLNFTRIQEVYKVHSNHAGWPLRWMLISLILAGMIAAAGWYGKQTQVSPMMKPLDWQIISEQVAALYNGEAISSTGIFSAAAKTGYGNDDAYLGGPLQADNQVVFTAKTSELTYWRGESKSFYDGKGWTHTEPAWTGFTPSAVPASEPTLTQEVLWASGSANKQIFYGGTLIQIEAALNDQGRPMGTNEAIIDEHNGKVAFPDISGPLSYYKLQSMPIKKDPEALNAEAAVYPSSITNEYLQLPDFPQNVRKLAEEITADIPSPYGKAAAIEQYLRSNYTYSLDKPTRPGKAEDFVSHFLFVDRTGYCNQFSSAMAVMLRSVGVPTRWVKGFAPGTPDTEDQRSEFDVTVRNKDAHSWVEVYFPNAGWIPFEPTPGFSGPVADHLQTAGLTVANPAAAPAFSQTKDKEPMLEGYKALLLDKWNAFLPRFMAHWKITAAIAGLCLFLFSIVVLFRKRLLDALHPGLNAGKTKRSGYHPAMHVMDRMWLKVYRRFGAKPGHLTVREYVSALQVEHDVQKKALMEFAQLYESIRYDVPTRPAYSKHEIAALWRAIHSPDKHFTS